MQLIGTQIECDILQSLNFPHIIHSGKILQVSTVAKVGGMIPPIADLGQLQGATTRGHGRFGWWGKRALPRTGLESGMKKPVQTSATFVGGFVIYGKLWEQKKRWENPKMMGLFENDGKQRKKLMSD